MSERITREEREALITGDQAAPLGAHEAAEVPFLADLLADPSTWAEPRPEVEDAVVSAVLGAHAEPPDVVPMRRRSGGPRWWRFAAAAVVVVIFAGAIVVT